MRIKLTLLTSIFVALSACMLSFGNDTNPQSASEEKDYSPYPNPDRGYITDIADILTVEEEEKIEGWLYTAEKDTNIEIVVVIIESIKDYPGTKNNSIEDFATGLFDAYGIGNMPKNDGVLLLVALEDRKARIELGSGYGHRRDRDAQRIMSTKIVPQFRKGNYTNGIIQGVRGILKEFSGITIIPSWIKLVVIIIIIALIPISISLFRNGKRGWGWISIGLIIALLLALIWLVRKTVEKLPARSGAGGFGGGFGGGFSGGGGATGSW